MTSQTKQKMQPKLCLQYAYASWHAVNDAKCVTAICPIPVDQMGTRKGPVSKTAAWPTNKECSSVGKTQLSDMGVGDELTVVCQVSWGITGQGLVDEGCNLEHDALPHRKPVQLYLLSAISLSHKQPWNMRPYTVSPLWPLQRAAPSSECLT